MFAQPLTLAAALGSAAVMPIHHATITVTPIQQNCTLLWDGVSKAGVVIDPGGDVDRILDAAQTMAVQVERIWLTHGHIDHAGGAAALRDALQVPIEGPDERDAFLLDALPQAGRQFGMTGARAVRPDRWLQDRDTVGFAGHTFMVRHCPGHTPGHVVFVAEGLAIVGDVLFRGAVGRTDFAYGDGPLLLRGIRDVLMPLPDETTVLCGHGPATTIGRERRANPFVKQALGSAP